VKGGVYLIHKAVGETSFAAVRERQRPGLKLCHGGALDPFACGLLPLLAGQATRLMPLLHALPKVYRAELVWGSETDSGDLHGTVVRGAPLPEPARLEEALAGFLGWREQVPPLTSNKWVEGERAYARAHRGEKFELPPSRVYLHRASWVSHQLEGDAAPTGGAARAGVPRAQRSVLELTCRGGYYVRSLARDLARTLGSAAHLSRLERLNIGPWRDPGLGAEVAVHGEALLTWCATRWVTDAELGALRKGEGIARGAVVAPEWTPPPGFPLEPAPPACALHRSAAGVRLVATLVERDGGWALDGELRGGI
jgi:tRNA pseudouridine55 synthase